MKINIEDIKNQFKKYVKTYNMNDRGISRKYYHSIRVMDLCLNISKHLSLSEEETEIAIVTGLLHDYARFYQWKNYHTYRDRDSIDHADKAIELLFQNNEIKNYYTIKKNYPKIFDAIKYHNKYSIPSNINKNHELICQIIRDADKIDIFYLSSMDKEVLIDDNSKITPIIEEEFYNNKLINRKNVKTPSDEILVNLGMFYDINLNYSKEYITKNNMIWKMFNNLTHKEKFKPYFKHVDEYIKNKSSQV